MHIGRPCSESNTMDEYFQDGITNGAQWYNVAGTIQNIFLHIARCTTNTSVQI